MARITKFQDLEMWQTACQLAGKIGELIDSGRLARNYRLIAQLEGSTGSIMDNIAEGFERGKTLEFIQFLGYAKGSCGELRSQICRCKIRNYITEEEYEYLLRLTNSISRQINGFIKYLQNCGKEGFRRKIKN